MSYERLTTVDKDGHIDIIGIWDVDMRKEDARKYYAAKKRLTELEDKIENGLLAELPCKEGDPVYKVYGSCDANAECPYGGGYGYWRCHYKDKCRCKPFVDKIQFNIMLLNEVGKTIFTTKAEAEAKLEELKEE